MSTTTSQFPGTDKVRRKFRGIEADERQNQRRAQLLEAGLEAFGTHGFQAAGVRDVCLQAKLTERYFYESFKNREALFLAVYEAAIARIEQAVFGALSNVSPGQAEPARVVLRAVLEFFRADPRVARIVLVEVLSLGAASGAAFASSASFAQMIEKLSVALYPELQGSEHDTGMIANGLYGSTIYISQRWTLEGFKEPLEKVLEHCALFYDAVAFKLSADKGKPVATVNAKKPRAKKTRGATPAPARSRRKA